MKKNYVFKFREIKFMTDDGTGDDEHVNHLLNTKFGGLTYQVRSSSQEEAFERTISHIVEVTGFNVLDADYEVSMT